MHQGGQSWNETRVNSCLSIQHPTLWVLAAGRTKQVLGSVEMDDRLYSTPVAANGVLYVTTA